MGFQSLHKTILLLRHPVLWIAGIFAGLISSCGIYLAFSGTDGAFYAERLFVFSLVLVPFFLAAVYGAVKKNDYSLKNYIKEGFSGYFRVLLPTVIILAVALIFLFLIAMPAAMTGMSGMLLFGGASVIILIPMILLVFFYDTAAVFEDKKVFECIKRSFEVSFARSVPILGFYVVALLILFVIFTGFSIVWSGILTEQFEPLLNMSDEELNSFATNPDAVVAMLGEYGVFITAVMTFFGAFIFTVFFIPYKAVFYRDFLMGTVVVQPGVSGPAAEPEGEYDEKGRWYKYS
ncbi:MAG: hypothetical protein PHV39_07990 [Methanomicrobium sp.]|nr:hypothetical protein [Methanomicrobium sp.]